uniref:Centrosomal protein 192 n=1 Tax=Leptobrachium leishanense TaxID=445787 RepID=A0A8C5R1G7_9ANUR
MTESFSKIEDETFPSFLGESITSNISGALENCTLTSNLGLPVAASTIAKFKALRLLVSTLFKYLFFFFLSDGSPTHSVVYQNDEGKWVTDLAYYKSFDNEQNMNFSAVEINANESDFIAGSDALAMIEEAQEEFEKEHQFIQDEKMDLENISLNMGDTSWKLPPSTLPRTSQVNSDLDQEDASYLRLSLGEFFGQRSEALGCLGGGQDVKRPSFGYHIISPEKQEPIVLLKPIDMSGASGHDDTIKFLDDTLTPGLYSNYILPCAIFCYNLLKFRLKRYPYYCIGLEQLCHNKFVSISKIASAITDASSSADPSLLAAMVMELSHKSKTLSVTPVCENPDCSISQALSTSHQNPAPGIVDMERYLKMTDISGREGEMESFAQSVKDFTWDMSLRCKQQQSLQDSLGDLTNITDVEKQDMRKPDKPKEVKECSLKLGSAREKAKTVCSVASMSRESIFANSNSDYTKSNDTIELSTTIVRASPTPSEMQGNPNSLSWQDKRNSASTSPIKPSKKSSASRPNEDGVLKLKDKSTLVNSVSTNTSAVNHFHEQHVPSNAAFPFQRYTMNTGQGIGSANFIPGLDNYPMIQSFAVNSQFVPGMKPNYTDLEKVPPSLQARLTGQPLTSTTFAQYLGGMPSIGNTASQTYQLGPSSLFSTHAGYSNCSITTQLNQPTASAMPPNSNVGSALLASLPLSGHMTEKPDHALSSVYTGQTLAAAGLRQWGSRISSGFEHVLVSEELTFTSACCVGIASQASLNIFNPNDRWMQVNFGILSISVNGEKIDAATYQCLVFKNKTLIGPRAGEEIKFLFLPQRSGLFQCVLGVSSWPVSADTETILRAEAIASKVIITAVSEYPLITVDTGKTDGLEFGDLPSGSWKALPLKLTNRTHATVPIRLIISANATAWRCFIFSKDPSTLSTEYPSQVDVSKVSSPSVLSHVMHATYDGKEPESLVIWIVFHAPQTYSSLGPAEVYVARVDVEVDSPGPACVLKSVPLHARAGCARIHAPKDLQNIHLLCNAGSSVKQLLPLKNAGNIAVHLRIKSTNPDSCFCVDPEDLFILPGEEQVVIVKFTPQYPKLQKSVLKIMVQPLGPQYEVSVIGETETTEMRNPINPPSINSADVPPILSNKQFVSWGGVALGRAVQQKLILRNTSTTSSQHLRLLIRGQDQDCFQLQNIFGREERLTSNRELTIQAKEDATIHLMFSPTRVGCMLARLEIKQSGIKSNLPGIKFTIPLSGYGGTSNLILEDVKKLSDNYMVALSGISSGRLCKVGILIKNTGSRAAYVKAMCFSDFQTNVLMDPKVFYVKPEKFVLKERTQQVITIFCNATEREEMLCRSTRAQIATVCFFCGDEVFVNQNVYRTYNLLFISVYDLPQRPNDTQLFYAKMNKIILSVIGSGQDGNMNERAQMVIRTSIDSSVGCTEGNLGNSSLDVLPVKGPQGPPLSSSTNKSIQKSAVPEQTWSIHPELLLLSAPTINLTHRQIKLINNSSRLFQFELSWPAHCLTITPQHGNVEPQSHVIILVSPNPSLATKPNLLPWSGQIYVHCDNGQKFVKVQISGDIRVDKQFVGIAPKQVPILLPHSDTPIHMAKPLLKSPSRKVEIKNRTLVFPTTISGESSETFLDIENPGDEDLNWLLSSFAPPYVKVSATSSVAVPMSIGTFEKQNRLSRIVAISFFPRDKGDYAQYWDLESHPISEPHLKHKVRFQLSGEVQHSKKPNPNGNSSSGSKNSLIKQKPIKQSPESARGVFAPQDLYTFPPTMVGDSSTLKVNLQNNSFSTYMVSLLKFVSPGEPFHMKHSKYSLRAHHYINLPVKFKPSSPGKFDGLLVVQSDAGNICIRLVGEALAA